MTGAPYRAAIGLGGNLGDRAKALDDAVAALAETPGVNLLAVSSYHQTDPAGGPEGQGAYLNAAVTVETALGPTDLLRALQGIELRAGRVRAERWGARTLDLDLLLAGPLCLRTPELILPHPLMAVRRFVLAPLAEIAPDVIHPTTGRAVSDLLNHLDRRPSRVEVIDADAPRRAAILDRLLATLDPASWIVSGAEPAGDRPAGNPTFRVNVGEPESGRPDPVPSIDVSPGDVEAIAAFILALCRASQGA